MYKGCNNLKPDFWVSPQHIWEIRFDSLSTSPSYKVGLNVVDDSRGISVRFGRFEKIRSDKSVSSATSVDQLIRMKMD
jgi:DNA ligase 1